VQTPDESAHAHAHEHTHAHHGSNGPREVWLQHMWPFVRGALPPAPARVLEIGCGPLGGFVPMMLRDGHHAVGVDPEAPDGPDYAQVEFERYEAPDAVDAVVASTSLHHVADLAEVLDRVMATLRPDGTLVVVEWMTERFDHATAQWCFDRLPVTSPENEPRWLQHARDEWAASAQPWDAYFQGWRRGEGLHSGEDMLDALGARFEPRVCTYGPYIFAELDAMTAADEQAAIDAGQIQATCLQYVAGLRPGQRERRSR
jgi:SAM-dependent methyltransferase